MSKLYDYEDRNSKVELNIAIEDSLNKELEDQWDTEVIEADWIESGGTCQFKFREDVYSWSILFLNLTNLNIVYKIWMVLNAILSAVISLFIIYKFMIYIDRDREREIQYYDDTYYYITPKYSFFDPNISQILGTTTNNIPSWREFTKVFYDLLKDDDITNLQHVSYSISEYDNDLLVVVLIGTVIILSKVYNKFNECIDYVRYAFYVKNWYLKIYSLFCAFILWSICFSTYWLTLVHLDTITNILDAFIKTCGCLLIFTIEESLYSMNQFLFMKSIIANIKSKKLNKEVTINNNIFFVIFEKICLIYLLIVPVKNFYYKIIAKEPLQLEPTFFYKPFRYS